MRSLMRGISYVVQYLRTGGVGGGVGGWGRGCTINAIFFIHASATEIILSYTDVYH